VWFRLVRALAALALAQVGDTAAENLSAGLDKEVPQGTLVQQYWHPTIKAAVALQRKDPKQAIASVEDVLIAKLRWAKMSGSERQLQDAAGIVSTQADNLDVSYVEGRVRKLSLDKQWDAVRDKG
jgi:hypothetical protein